MFKDILLLIIGGVITFIVTLVVNRISRRVPCMTWRFLPPVHLQSQGLTAFNIVIANTGNESATNVESVIELPDDAQIDSLEVEPSQSSLKYTITKNAEHKNKIAVTFPRFHSNVDCVFSFLARKKDLTDLNVSITGDGDVIGEEDKGLTPESMKKLHRRMNYIGYGCMAVLIIITFAFVVWILASSIAFDGSMQKIAMGDIRYNSGDFQGALETYSQGSEKWSLPVEPALKYRMARTYAQLTNEVASVVCLKDLIDHDHVEAAAFCLIDPAFEKIRQTKEFTALSKEISEKRQQP